MQPKQITDSNGVTRDYVNGEEVMSFYGTITGSGAQREVQFYVSGVINMDTVLNFVNEVNIFVEGGADLIVDMAGLSYINSKALLELWGMQQRIEEKGCGRLRLVNLPANIKQEFVRTGYSEVLEIV